MDELQIRFSPFSNLLLSVNIIVFSQKLKKKKKKQKKKKIFFQVFDLIYNRTNIAGKWTLITK